jgi:branched-chain amino acid transport system substrate-binding protein
MDVAASATALAAIQVAKTKNKIVVLNGPGAVNITNEACTPVSIHYTYDNYALSHGTGTAIVKAGYDTWFFLTADYAFGHDLEQNATAVVKANGGQVLGGVRLPINTSDFSSALLQAQSSKAKVVGSRTPAPTQPMPSNRRPSLVSCAVDRNWHGCSSSSTTSTPSAWRRRKACC